MFRRITDLGVLVALSFSVLAARAVAEEQDPRGLLPEAYLPELKSLLSKAVSQSPQALQAQFEVARTHVNEMVESAAMWPSLNASVNWAGVQSSIDGNNGSKIRSRNSGLFYTLSLYQPVFHWGALKAQSDVGKLQTQIAEQRYADTYRMLALTIRSTYLDLIQRKKAWLYGKATLQQAQSRFEALQQRHNAGAISAAELSEPQLRLAETRIAADRMEEAFVQGCRAVAALCGVPELTPDQVPDDFPKPGANESHLDSLYRLGDRFDPAKTPQGIINELSIKQNDLNYRIARARTLPKVGVSAMASENNSTTAFGGGISQQNVSQQQVGVAVYWAIFDGFAARGSKLALLEQRRQLDLTMSEYHRVQRERISSLRKQIGFAVRSLEVSETRLSIANNSVSVIAAEVKSGHSSPDGLETVQANARSTELTTLSYRTELFARVAEYLSTVGADPVMVGIDERFEKHGH
ncbi:TolC family protein [Nibricoccus sp. IMCC34717]|uniref:TolC family protein n=1 Tax=Nibricoccus sp. IMCC34717 TaxID=3034021 RepID=UPI0038508B2A